MPRYRVTLTTTAWTTEDVEAENEDAAAEDAVMLPHLIALACDDNWMVEEVEPLDESE